LGYVGTTLLQRVSARKNSITSVFPSITCCLSLEFL
jgi:hypothetical protein